MSEEAHLPSSSISEEDWAGKASATAVGYVDTVRDATTGKAIVASRKAVYYIAIGLIAVVVLILFLILLVRALVILTSLFPFMDAGEVWLTYMFLGAVFMGAGMFAWRKKGA